MTAQLIAKAPAGSVGASLSQRMPDSSQIGSPQLLERTFVVLSLFTPEKRDWTVTEIARACGLPVPTVYRIVSALQRNGFLSRQDDSKRYWLGPAILRLGRTAAMSANLRAVSRPVLRDIAMRIKGTAVLTAVSESGCSAICLERVDSREPLRLSVQPGREVPLYAGASQKMLLANLPVMDKNRILDAPLKQLCTRTIIDADSLRTELNSIHRKGWAASCEETNRGIWGLAVGLVDEFGNSVAAIGLAGSCDRKPRDLRPWLSVLGDGAAEVAAQLGLQPTVTIVRADASQLAVNGHRS